MNAPLKKRPLWEVMNVVFRAHPWHSVDIGPDAPEVVTTYIEVVPSDTVKYEIDKPTGLLKVDRPQKYSNVCPTLYGLVPQTYCGESVAELNMEKTGRKGIVGDADPLDICVLTEKDIPRGDLLVDAIPIGGFRMIDDNEADDKIIAVLKDDLLYGNWRDIHECESKVVERLKHYFLTYKEAPDGEKSIKVEIDAVYGRDEALEVIRRSQADYNEHFGQIEELLHESVYEAVT